MPLIITPSEFAPTYYIEVDEQRRFVRLLKIMALPPEFDGQPGQYEIPITDEFIRYARQLLGE